MQRVIGIGETVMDILFKDDQPQKAVPGGSTFNSIISLGRAGVPCAMLTEVGGDHIGELICNFLRDNGVATDYVCRHEHIKSHISLAFLDENNDAQYIFYKDHASVTLDGPLPEIRKDDVVLFGSFFAINPAIRPVVGALLRAAHEAGAWLYYDVNFRKNHIADLPRVMANIEENMSLANVVRGSMEDFGFLYGLHDADAVYERVRRHCPTLILTDGARPIRVYTPEGWWRPSAPWAQATTSMPVTSTPSSPCSQHPSARPNGTLHTWRTLNPHPSSLNPHPAPPNPPSSLWRSVGVRMSAARLATTSAPPSPPPFLKARVEEKLEHRISTDDE